MKDIYFDIKKFSYTKDENVDVSFIPMLLRRKLNKFGRIALASLYKAYDNNNDINLVFASDYGDFERVQKLINQRREENSVSPAGFSASVHNATIGLFSLLEKIKSGYNSISAGEKTFSYGLLESILHYSKDKDCLYCYTDNFDEPKSVSVLLSPNKNGKYLITNNPNKNCADVFENFTDFLDGKTDEFASDLYLIRRLEK